MTPEQVSGRESVDTKAILDQRIGNLACAGDCIATTFADTLRLISDLPLDELSKQTALARQITRLDLAVTEALNPIPADLSNDESAETEHQNITDQYIASLVGAITPELGSIEAIDPNQIDHLLTETISPATINMIKNPHIKEGVYIDVILAIGIDLPNEREDKKDKIRPYFEGYVRVLDETDKEDSEADLANSRINLALLASVCELGDEEVTNHLALAHELSGKAETPLSLRDRSDEVKFLLRRAATPEGAIKIAGLLSRMEVFAISKTADMPPRGIPFLEKFEELLMLENSGAHRNSQPIVSHQQRLKKGMYEELKGMSAEEHGALFTPKNETLDGYYSSLKVMQLLAKSIYGGYPDTEGESPELMKILLDSRKLFPEGKLHIKEERDGSLRQFELDLKSSNQEKRLFMYNMVENMSDNPLVKNFLVLGIASASNVDPYSRKVFLKHAEYLRETAMRHVSRKQRRVMQRLLTDIMSR